MKYVNFCILIFFNKCKSNDVTVCMYSLQEIPVSLKTKGPDWSINMFGVLTRNFYSNTKFMRASAFSSPAFTSFPSKWCFIFCSYPIFSTLFEVLYYPTIHGLADIENPVINRQGQNFKNTKTLRSAILWQRCSFVPTNWHWHWVCYTVAQLQVGLFVSIALLALFICPELI